MKKLLPLKFFFISSFILCFFFLSKTPAFSWDDCDNYNRVTGEPKISGVPLCSSSLIPYEEEGTALWNCYCVECTDDSHCQNNYGPDYVCNTTNHDCYLRGGGTCSNFDPTSPTPGTCSGGTHPLVTGPNARTNLYTCTCVECTETIPCQTPNICINYHCQSPTSQGQPIPTLNPWGKCGTNVAIDTAIGCIPVDPSLFVQTFITLIIGLAGVIAFLLMVFAAIKIILAGGNPEKLQAGKEMLTSAIIGLILIIFSTVILELIGVHILQIPGFLEFK